MKTTNNFQKSGNLKTIRKFLLVGAALVFISFSTKAQNFNLALDNDRATILALETSVSHSGEIRTSQTAIKTETEFSLQIEGLMNIIDYNPAQFIESEMAHEIERWMNSGTEAEQTNLSLQIESLMNINKYSALEFVEAEIALETERWMTSVKF